MGVSPNLRLKTPAKKQDRVREYARYKTRAKADAKRCQEILVTDTANRLRSRYLAQTRRLRNPVQFATWLIESRALEFTFSTRFGNPTRRFWAHRLLEEASDVTLGADQSLDWFARALEVQLGEIVKVRIGPQTISGAEIDDLTLYFRSNVS